MHRILVIGTGSIGERHVRCFLNTGRAEVGICEANKELLESIASRYNISETFSDLETAFKEKWDAAVIATPANTHIPIALKVAESNTNLFIEKPLSTNLKNIKQLVDIISNKQLLAAVGYTYRAHPCITDMKKAIESGRFGRILQVMANAGQYFPFYRPAYKNTYFADRTKGGGVIQDGLTHIINLCEWFVGPVDRVVADADNKALKDVKVEDTVHVICRHGDIMGCYNFNLHQAPNEITITIVYEKATLRFELHQSRWMWMTEPGGKWQGNHTIKVDRDEWFTAQENAFLDVLEGKAKPLCTIQEAYQTLKAILAILDSTDKPSKWEILTIES